jgi:hypothetical protein
MGNAMKSTFGIGIACISVLVLCTGAVPAGFFLKEKFEVKRRKK